MKVDPRARLAIVRAQTALLRARVGQRKLQFLGGRTQLADLHRSAYQILMFIVLRLVADVLVHDESPMVFSRDHVNALRPGPYLCLVEDEIHWCEQYYGRTAGSPGFSILWLLLIAQDRNVPDADLVAVLESANGCDRIGFGIRQSKHIENETERQITSL